MTEGDFILVSESARGTHLIKMNQTTDKKQDYLALAINEIEDYAIILMDPDGNIVNWNKGAQNIKGYTSEDIIGKNFRRFYTDEDRKTDKPGRLIKIATETGRAQDEGWRVRKDGSLFWGSITITAVHDESGILVGFSKVTRDLTERKAADLEREIHENQLQSKNKELEQFLYIASHDLQEPIRTISSFNALLSRKYDENFDDDGKKMLGYIGQACNHMVDLIKGLLEYGRIGREKIISDIDCNEILEAVKNDLSLAISDSKARIIYENLPVIRGYKVELRLLFQNLISNAIKFRKPDQAPEIHISAEDNHKCWKFSIKDNGIGIEPKYKDKIFQIFQRLHLASEYAGSGIGLAHCTKIVELHGGKIWVDSIPGEGSTFYFTISKQLKQI